MAVPPDELQFRVCASTGGIIAIADFVWWRFGVRVVGEADGVDAHDNPSHSSGTGPGRTTLSRPATGPSRFAWPDTLDAATVPRLIRGAIAGAQAALTRPA